MLLISIIATLTSRYKMDSMRVNLKFFEGTIYEEKKETNETLFFKDGKRKV